jgi:hypothetical protein
MGEEESKLVEVLREFNLMGETFYMREKATYCKRGCHAILRLSRISKSHN